MKRLNYYQVHKNKKPVKRKHISDIVYQTGINLFYYKSNDFRESFFKLSKIKYKEKELSKFIKEIHKQQKKQMYLNRIKK
jgi:hypothetical protein